MEFVFKHEVVFGTHGKIKVSDVAKSLVANEELLIVAVNVLECCVEGLIVEKININFSSCTTNSPLK